MNRFQPNNTPCGQTRREFLWEVGGGFAGLALLDLMASEGLLAAGSGAAEYDSPGNLLSARPPHFAAPSWQTIHSNCCN